MAKIPYWDAETLTMKDSQDDYRSISLVHIGESAQAVTTVHLHERSGIMVHDVAAFENWLSAVFPP